MATDLAEFIGAAIGLNILFGIPLFPAALITSVAAFAILALQARGFRRLEAVIVAFIGVIVVAFAAQVVPRRPGSARTSRRGFVPGFEGSESVLLAVGILGATVMPHVIYLHSALTQHRVVRRERGGEAPHLPLRAGRRHDRDGDRGPRQHEHARDQRRRCSTGTG